MGLAKDRQKALTVSHKEPKYTLPQRVFPGPLTAKYVVKAEASQAPINTNHCFLVKPPSQYHPLLNKDLLSTQ